MEYNVKDDNDSKIRLSPYAVIFYHDWLRFPNASHYNMVFDQILYGSLDAERLQDALQRYVKAHFTLNSHVILKEKIPCWAINTTITSLQRLKHPTTNEQLLNYVSQPFDLYEGPLYRFFLQELSKCVYRLTLVFHHIVIDGVSADNGVIETINRFYNEENYTLELSNEQQRQKLQNLSSLCEQRINNNKLSYQLFWKERLSIDQAIDLTFLRASTYSKVNTKRVDNVKVNEINFSATSQQFKQLEKLKYQYKITPYLYSLSIYLLLLYRYTGQNQIAVAHPIAIKEGKDFIYGAQVNVNIVPVTINATTTICDLFKQVKKILTQSIKGIQMGYYPIDAVVSENDCKPLLDVVFCAANMRNTPFTFAGINKVKISKETAVDGVEKNRLLLEQEISGNKINYRLRFRDNAFYSVLLNNFVRYYQKLFSDVLIDLENSRHNRVLYSYKLLKNDEIKMIIQENSFEKKTISVNTNETLIERFESQAEKNPEKVALIYNTSRITYKILNNNVNKLTKILQENYSISHNKLIGMYFNRSYEMIVTMLAILKAGAGYLPIDTKNPFKRTKYIIADSRITYLLTSELHVNIFDSISLNIHKCCSINNQIYICQVNKNKFNTEIIKKIAYTIYTSGSTGIPNAVQQTHQNVLDLFKISKNIFSFSNNDIWILLHSYAFDFSVWEIWGAFLYGGVLILPNNKEIYDVSLLYGLFCHEKPTVLNFTPQMFRLFACYISCNKIKEKLESLRVIILGGDVVDNSSLKKWFSLHNDSAPKIYNGYGLTEATIFSSFSRLREKNVTNHANIGQALSDQRMFLLDDYNTVKPLGAIGELHISGSRLCTGYPNNKTLTQVRFKREFNNKFIGDNQYFKTGDLMRLLPSGKFQFIGRNDKQAKIRGYRIDLSEISNTLEDFPRIKQALVVVQYIAGEPELFVYYVSRSKIKIKALKEYLSKFLPAYMLPTNYIKIDEIPLNVNGKLDIKSLPLSSPKIDDTNTQGTIKSRNEKIILAAFARVLKQRNIRSKDNFFDLGGNSLKVVDLFFLLQEYFKIHVQDIYEYQTAYKLARKLVRRKEKSPCQPLQTTSIDKKDNAIAKVTDQIRIKTYFDEVKALRLSSFVKKNVNAVILSGSTGFLGCHLLNKLLTDTNYKIILLIRDRTLENAYARLSTIYEFYYGESLEKYKNRTLLLLVQLEKFMLGLDKVEYNGLIDSNASIIHAAGFVNHHGMQHNFITSNVLTTKNLLALSKQTYLKDFHYISSYSVVNGLIESNIKQTVFIEDDLPKWQPQKNLYIKTKLQAEYEVLRYRELGVNGTIYRVGNLAYANKGYRIQKNINSNAFASTMNAFINIGNIPSDARFVEISPADNVAKAIVRLFTRKMTNNITLHLFNPDLFDLKEILTFRTELAFCDTVEFIEKCTYYLKRNPTDVYIKRLLVNPQYLQHQPFQNTKIKIMQEKTNVFLENISFSWDKVNGTIFKRYLEKIINNMSHSYEKNNIV